MLIGGFERTCYKVESLNQTLNKRVNKIILKVVKNVTCLNCIKHDICDVKRKLMLTYDYSMKLVYQMNVEKSCNEFDNKDDYEKVVRCENCNNAIEMPHGNYHCKIHNKTFIKSYYCGDGDRK